MRETIRVTVLGGIVFLLPLVCVVVFMSKAFQIMKTLGTPLSKLIPVENLMGIAVVELLTGLLLFLACLLAGLVARSRPGKTLYKRLDAILLELIPGYSWIKGVTGDISDQEAQDSFTPVLIRFDDQYQLGYQVELLADDIAAVYVPGAPDARAGAVSYVTNDRIKVLDKDFGSVSRLSKKLGRGSSETLAGVRFV